MWSDFVFDEAFHASIEEDCEYPDSEEKFWDHVDALEDAYWAIYKPHEQEPHPIMARVVRNKDNVTCAFSPDVTLNHSEPSFLVGMVRI